MVISLDSRVTIPADVLFHLLSGETVLLNLKNGVYYGLDEVGTRTWELLAQHGRLAPVVQALALEYDATEIQLSADLIELVNRLLALGLLQIADAGRGDAT